MTSSNGYIFRVTGPLWGEPLVPGGFPSQRASNSCFDVFFDISLNKRLNKHSSRRWFETLYRSLWHHYNKISAIMKLVEWWCTLQTFVFDHICLYRRLLNAKILPNMCSWRLTIFTTSFIDEFWTVNSSKRHLRKTKWDTISLSSLTKRSYLPWSFHARALRNYWSKWTIITQWKKIRGWLGSSPKNLTNPSPSTVFRHIWCRCLFITVTS